MRNRNSTIFLSLIVFLLIFTGCRKTDKPVVPLTDADGNTYKTVSIGSQEWMAENLRTTKFSDGTEITLVKDSVAWRNLLKPGYCWYDNDETAYKNSLGALYNGFTVASGQLCPAGWHVPSKEEWLQLRDYLGDSLKAGGKLKETGTAHWLTPNKGADNSTGFGAFAAGYRYFEGSFSSVLSYTAFWTANDSINTDGWFAGLYYADASLVIEHRNKKHGFSVRCIKN
jgi:uncharacterized protein (TIGR02145 family)